jgi:6-phosphogluconolactonase (cycloisomerase 2 family)
MTTPSQGAIQTAFGGRLLLVADPGSNQVSVLWINPDGSLTPAGGSPFASNGILPISIAVHDDLVYVANGGNGGSNYTGFRLTSSGGLAPIPGSTFPLPDNSQPGDVLFDATGRHLVGTRVNTSLIDSFAVDDDGRLSPQGAVPFAAQGVGPFGSAFRPNGAPQLFVTNAHNGGTNGTVSAFRVSPDGRLASIGASPYPDHQTAPCWAAITPDSRYLFVTNTGSSSISSYAIAPDGSLSLIGSTPLKGSGLAALDLGVDPSGRYVYVVDDGARAVSALAINAGGTLTELVSSPFALPAGTFPFGIAMT